MTQRPSEEAAGKKGTWQHGFQGEVEGEGEKELKSKGRRSGTKQHDSLSSTAVICRHRGKPSRKEEWRCHSLRERMRSWMVMDAEQKGWMWDDISWDKIGVSICDDGLSG